MVPRKSCKPKMWVHQNLNIESISRTTLQVQMRSFANFHLVVFWRGGEVGRISIGFTQIIESLPNFLILLFLAFLSLSRIISQPQTREVVIINSCSWLQENGLDFEDFLKNNKALWRSSTCPLLPFSQSTEHHDHCKMMIGWREKKYAWLDDYLQLAWQQQCGQVFQGYCWQYWEIWWGQLR